MEIVQEDGGVYIVHWDPAIVSIGVPLPFDQVV